MGTMSGQCGASPQRVAVEQDQRGYITPALSKSTAVNENSLDEVRPETKNRFRACYYFLKGNSNFFKVIARFFYARHFFNWILSHKIYKCKEALSQGSCVSNLDTLTALQESKPLCQRPNALWSSKINSSYLKNQTNTKPNYDALPM